MCPLLKAQNDFLLDAESVSCIQALNNLCCNSYLHVFRKVPSPDALNIADESSGKLIPIGGNLVTMSLNLGPNIVKSQLKQTFIAHPGTNFNKPGTQRIRCALGLPTANCCNRKWN